MSAWTMRSHALHFVAAASLGASLTTILMIFFPPIIEARHYWQELLVGTVFAAICVGGGIAALFPRKCAITSEGHTTQFLLASSPEGGRNLTIRGHHPDCGEFLAHTVRLDGTVHCAACSGLFIGAVLALVATVLCFFLGANVSGFSFAAVIFGQAGISIGLLQFRFKGTIRLLANVFFVLGGCMTLIGIDQYVHSLFLDLYVLGAVLLWIFTRMTISQWDHSRICTRCGFSCNIERKKGVV